MYSKLEIEQEEHTGRAYRKSIQEKHTQGGFNKWLLFTMTDLYMLFGVESTATVDEINKAVALKLQGIQEGTDRHTYLAACHGILKDPKERQAYDNTRYWVSYLLLVYFVPFRSINDVLYSLLMFPIVLPVLFFVAAVVAAAAASIVLMGGSMVSLLTADLNLFGDVMVYALLAFAASAFLVLAAITHPILGSVAFVCRTGTTIADMAVDSVACVRRKIGFFAEPSSLALNDGVLGNDFGQHESKAPISPSPNSPTS